MDDSKKRENRRGRQRYLSHSIAEPLHRDVRLPYPEPAHEPEHGGHGDDERERERDDDDEREQQEQRHAGLDDQEVEERLVRRWVCEL